MRVKALTVIALLFAVLLAPTSVGAQEVEQEIPGDSSSTFEEVNEQETTSVNDEEIETVEVETSSTIPEGETYEDGALECESHPRRLNLSEGVNSFNLPVTQEVQAGSTVTITGSLFDPCYPNEPRLVLFELEEFLQECERADVYLITDNSSVIFIDTTAELPHGQEGIPFKFETELLADTSITSVLFAHASAPRGSHDGCSPAGNAQSFEIRGIELSVTDPEPVETLVFVCIDGEVEKVPEERRGGIPEFADSGECPEEEPAPTPTSVPAPSEPDPVGNPDDQPTPAEPVEPMLALTGPAEVAGVLTALGASLTVAGGAMVRSRRNSLLFMQGVE